MKKLSGILLCSILQLSVFAQDDKTDSLTCKDAHQGMFDVFYQNMKIVVKREGNFQYEYAGANYIKYNITWLSDCEYKLVVIETDIEQAKEYIGETCTTTITGIEDDKFKYTCVYEKANKTLRGYMKKQKVDADYLRKK